MKKGFLVSGLLLLSTHLQAEVKPAGTVLYNECGHLNRSVKICTAIAEDSKNNYLVLTGFAFRKARLSGEYFPASVEIAGGIGARNETYTATVLMNDGNYVVEKTYELHISQVVYPNAKALAKLYVNGKLIQENIEMETIYHTESL